MNQERRNHDRRQCERRNLDCPVEMYAHRSNRRMKSRRIRDRRSV